MPPWRRHQGVTGQPRRAETTAKRSHTFTNVNFSGSPRPQNLVNFVRPSVRPAGARPRRQAVQIAIFCRTQNPSYLQELFCANFMRFAPLEGMVDFGRDQNANCRRMAELLVE